MSQRGSRRSECLTQAATSDLVKRKREDKWYVKVRFPSGKQWGQCLGPHWTEKGRPPAGYYTRKTAKAALHEILTDIRRGVTPDPGASYNHADPTGKTFGDAVAEWLRYCEQDKAVKPSTLRDYRNATECELLPVFESARPMVTFDKDLIELYRQQLLDEGRLSRRTAQKYLVILGSILKRAKQIGWVEKNPVEDVDKINVPRSSGQFNVLKREQVLAIVRAADPMFSSAILVAAYTGLRTGELRALRWSDVEFGSGLIRVQRNMPVHGDEGTPKSGKARSVPMFDDVAAELDRLSRREFYVSPSDFVFTLWGDPLGEDVLRKALYAAMEATGLDRKDSIQFPARGGFTFHDLRHTFGTTAVQVPGWSLIDVKAMMGHADVQTTQQYTHHIPKHDDAAALTRFIHAQDAVDSAVPSGTQRVRAREGSESNPLISSGFTPGR